MSDPTPHEQTRQLASSEPPISYTEEYGPERTLVAPPAPAGDGPLRTGGGPTRTESDEVMGRRFSTPTVVFTAIVALLLGVILALSLLPDEEQTVALDDAAAQQALADSAAQASELQASVDALNAQNAQLQADLAARDAEIARLQAEAAGSQSAATQAQDERQAALDERQAALDAREAALDDREAAVDDRETVVAERETAAQQQEDDAAANTGSSLPDIGNVDIPIDLPQLDEEQARGVFERLVDRLRDIFGVQ